MCDTMLASPAGTADGIMLFAKNSDRQRNEAQGLDLLPPAVHATDERLKCTYITIPQAPRTHAVLLSRPFWIWGAEMGANEHGVTIGNEGLRARGPVPEDKALIGMDLLRLGLERGASAAEAVEVITSLLERYGQGGDCGHLAPAFYHNSFLIADPKEAFVLETVGREWLLERAQGIRAISNDYSVARNPERTSKGLPQLLREFGWQGSADPEYPQLIADPARAHIGSACARRERAAALLGARKGQVRVADMMSALRDHHSPAVAPEQWRPGESPSICVHAGGPERIAQTTGSLVSELRAANAVHWVTGTAAPCISVFKPVMLDLPLPLQGPRPDDQFNPTTLWWDHERLHRAAIQGDFSRFLGDIQQERDALEADFHARVSAVANGGSREERARVLTQCWQAAAEAQERWFVYVKPVAAPDTPYRAEWAQMNRLAGIDPA